MEGTAAPVPSGCTTWPAELLDHPRAFRAADPDRASGASLGSAALSLCRTPLSEGKSGEPTAAGGRLGTPACSYIPLADSNTPATGSAASGSVKPEEEEEAAILQGDGHAKQEVDVWGVKKGKGQVVEEGRGKGVNGGRGELVTWDGEELVGDKVEGGGIAPGTDSPAGFISSPVAPAVA